MVSLSVWTHVRFDQRKFCVAPVLQEDAAMDSVPENAELEAPLDAMRHRLRPLHGPVYGTKEPLWKRLVEFEEVARKDTALPRELAADLEARRQVLRNKNEALQFFQCQIRRLLQQLMLMYRHIFRRNHARYKFCQMVKRRRSYWPDD